MVRKPNRMYHEIEGQVYTRKEYMGGIPNCRITQFDTGNVKQHYRFHFDLRAREAVQVQDKSLEAARVSLVRVMDKVASNNFHIKVRKYPHAILREHKMATGAGADRISDGMRLAFGKPVGHAVRAQIGDTLITLSCRSENVNDAKEAVRKASTKLPTPIDVVVIEQADLIEETRAAAVAPILVKKEKEEVAPVEGAEGAAGEGAAKEEGGEKGEKAEKGEKGEKDAKGEKPAAGAKAPAAEKAAPAAKKGK